MEKENKKGCTYDRRLAVLQEDCMSEYWGNYWNTEWTCPSYSN